MSTRCTRAMGKDFHLFHEMLDDPKGQFIYLRIDRDHSSTEIEIPVHIWETIRKIPCVKFDIADWTDKEILAKVESEISSWHEDHQKSQAEVDEIPPEEAEKKERRQKFASFLTWHPIFGEITDPKEDHIRLGITHYRGIRSRLKAIRKKMSKHEFISEPDEEDA